MTPLIPCLCFLVVVFLSGDDERLCFARFFKEPMILRHSCEKASEVLNDADFKVRSGLILTKYRCKKFTFSLNLHNPNVSVMDERMLNYGTRTEMITKRLKDFVYWKIWQHDTTFLRS